MSLYCTQDHYLQVPLNYAEPQGETITVFAREVFLPEVKAEKYLLFLQGGPGFAAPEKPEEYAWILAAAQHFRIILLDQRGTGKSQSVTADSLKHFQTPEHQAAYLQHFRADAIVQDAEQFRLRCFNNASWSLLGQSFGGFVCVCYLSMFPQGLDQVMICGGLPPLPHYSAYEVYQKLLPTIATRNQDWYATQSEGVKYIKKIMKQLPYQLPDGGQLSIDRLRDLGLLLGATDGFESLEKLLGVQVRSDGMSASGPPRLDWPRVKAIIDQSPYETNPLYAVMHESIYCHGQASQWGAARALTACSDFDAQSEPLYLYGELIRPDQFFDYAQLREFEAVAEILAQKTDWPVLYDVECLARNQVPVVALVYEQDFYVDLSLSLETARAIKNCKVWQHPTWQHDAIRKQGKAVIEGLLERCLSR